MQVSSPLTFSCLLTNLLVDGVLDDCPGIPASTDILLGVATIPLSNLLSHKSGVRRWFPIGPPPDLYSLTGTHDPMMGALKVQMNFTGSNDINNIIDAASRVGHQLSPHGIDTTGSLSSKLLRFLSGWLLVHTYLFPLADVVYDELTEVSIEIDWFSLPSFMVMRDDEDCLPLTAYCYIKTNFYNDGEILTVYSLLFYPS